MELARWSSFCNFRKMTFRELTWIFSFLTRENLVFFQIFLLTSIKAYLCPNIINFDSVDFSERRPEEVISFFWRSVYYQSNILSTLVYSLYSSHHHQSFIISFKVLLHGNLGGMHSCSKNWYCHVIRRMSNLMIPYNFSLFTKLRGAVG